MPPPGFNKRLLIPLGLGVLAVAGLSYWLIWDPARFLTARVPGNDRVSNSEASGAANPVLAGKLVLSEGKAGALTGSWAGFRGTDRDGISKAGPPLTRSWSGSGLRQLWTLELGDGYAGAAVRNGRVYVLDYDRAGTNDALRCLSAEDGAEIWRYSYRNSVKRNHGMSRTVPAVTDSCVVSLGPKCHVVCLDATTGQLRWGLDLVKDYGATVPPWYAGQCPLIEDGRVIVAPGGPRALLLAVDANTGKVQWQTPNPHGWRMTHSSVMPMSVDNERMYVYCANNGVVGVSAKDGALLWETAAWKISIATVPSPLILDGGRLFLTGGYNSGSLMLQVSQDRGKWQVQPLFKLDSTIFGATQHTPIFFEDHIYGVRADGRFVCLSLDGRIAWTSDVGEQFGLGGFLIADGLVFSMNDSGLLRLFEASPERFKLLGQAKLLEGHESWAPLALADGRLYVRDLAHMVCIDVARH